MVEVGAGSEEEGGGRNTKRGLSNCSSMWKGEKREVRKGSAGGGVIEVKDAKEGKKDVKRNDNCLN